jgi:flavin-dependent dehydrogenase
MCSRAAFCDGKALLAGDALAALRLMSGLGTNGAARSALALGEVVEGRLSLGEWEVGVRNEGGFVWERASGSLGGMRLGLVDV